jgi:restriction system protein
VRATAVPDFQTIMRPMLTILADESERTVTQIRSRLADESLNQEDLEAQKIPSGRAKLFANRVGSATTHLYQSGLIERPRRSVYHITPRGQEILAQHPDRVDLRVLSQFEEFHEFRGRTPVTDAAPTTEIAFEPGGSAGCARTLRKRRLDTHLRSLTRSNDPQSCLVRVIGVGVILGASEPAPV